MKLSLTYLARLGDEGRRYAAQDWVRAYVDTMTKPMYRHEINIAVLDATVEVPTTFEEFGSSESLIREVLFVISYAVSDLEKAGDLCHGDLDCRLMPASRSR